MIEIYGTATARNFENYKLFYQNNTEWIQIHESTSSVSYGALYTWDVTNLEKDKTYYVKLEVSGINHTSIDMVLITLNDASNNEDILIEVSSSVNESEYFNVKIFDESHDPLNAFVVFLSLIHI